MGAISPSKMPKGVRKARRDDTDFTQYNEGGEVDSSEESVKLGVENPRFMNSKYFKELAGRLTAEKKLDKDTTLQAYLDASLNNQKSGIQGGGVRLTRNFKSGGNVGLYANINAKRERGAKMRKPGQKGAPTDQAFIDSAKTARK
jgi:hypothetical protein